jgi:DnaJ-domain-containing protein 1
LERAQREQREAKQKQVDELKQLSKLVVECHKMSQKEDNTYRDVIDELQRRRGMKKVAESELQEKIVVKHLANIKKIKQQYTMVF